MDSRMITVVVMLGSIDETASFTFLGFILQYFCYKKSHRSIVYLFA